MMEISTYWKDPDLKEKAIVKLDTEVDQFYIDYYDVSGNIFYTEQFEGKSSHFVEDAAENWALGIKKLDDVLKQGSLL
tara:strand:+ start:806 stop:1039 length:234 start_codon:yes stop_codon:yes gene_type:complete